MIEKQYINQNRSYLPFERLARLHIDFSRFSAITVILFHDHHESQAQSSSSYLEAIHHLVFFINQSSGPYSRFESVSDDDTCRSPGAYPLSLHEPSVPNIDERTNSIGDRHFLGPRCSSLTSNTSDFTYSNTASPPEDDPCQPRKNSSCSVGRKQRRTAGERSVPSTSLNDEPPPLPLPRSASPNISPPTRKPVPKPVPHPDDHRPVANISRQQSEYQNSEF